MAEPSKKNMLLLSGSKAAGNLPHGESPEFLKFAEPWIKEFFAEPAAAKKPILFIPYARPDAMSEEAYFLEKVKPAFDKMGIPVICAPTTGVTEKMLDESGGIFIGGGHTYTLLDKLQRTGSLETIRRKVEQGLPYLGSSAGTIIACPTIKTTNDMPGMAGNIINVNSFGLIGAQLNCHYIDNSMHDPQHQGETRDGRIKEVCAFNPDMTVLGLYEGQALRVNGDKTHLWTSDQARGKNSPVFRKDTREEIPCEIGVAKDVSRIFEVRKKSILEHGG
jgi:dipeptidase E